MEAFLRRVDKACGILTTALLMALAGALLLQIVLRNIFNMGPAWVEESVRLFHIVMVFLALPLLEREKLQIKVDFIVDLFPQRFRNALRMAAQAATLVFAAFFLYSGYVLIKKTGDMLMSGTRLPNAVLFVPVMIGVVLFAIASVASLLTQIKAMKSGEAS